MGTANSNPDQTLHLWHWPVNFGTTTQTQQAAQEAQLQDPHPTGYLQRLWHNKSYSFYDASRSDGWLNKPSEKLIQDDERDSLRGAKSKRKREL